MEMIKKLIRLFKKKQDIDVAVVEQLKEKGIRAFF